ncbi:MAG: ATP-binding protein [Clostridiales bacterium]|nr:ATP-binding protein [Clostridiales bacterium]
MTVLEELILYRNFENGQIIEDMCRILEQMGDESAVSHPLTGTDAEAREQLRERFFSCMHALIDLAGTYGFEGNLWHNYLALLLVNNENVFSTSCEIRGIADGSLLTLAKHDFSVFMKLFALDFSGLEEKLDVGFFEEILHYRRGTAEGRVFNRRIRDRICELARQLAEVSLASDTEAPPGTSVSSGAAAIPMQTDPALDRFTGYMVRFYREFGVGKFGLHKAFRVEHGKDGVQILPITNIAHVKLDDLVGYEIQKKKLIDNTEAFLKGKKANNCLLFGDAGTGKSSSIKGILNRYYDQGLRMIEIYKHQFQDLNAVIAQIKNRNYKFIIYMDDLSFEEFEIEYKYLKAVIEGGLERKPENVLIYATSNRRHLIREQYGDNMEGDIGKPAEIHATHGGDLHVSDTVQEKLSLSSRFGVTIYFGSPDKKQFQNIVRTLAERYGITMPEEELLAEANKWELSHGGLSGRTAQQFVDYISAMQ